LKQVIEEIYSNKGSEVDWSDSDVEQEEASVVDWSDSDVEQEEASVVDWSDSDVEQQEASVPTNMSSDSSDSDAELQTRDDQISGYPPSRVRGRTRGRTVRESRVTGSQQPSDMEKDWKIDGSVQDIPFSSIPGISNASNVNEYLSPFQVFHIFVNNDIISHIKTETNKYADTTNCRTKKKRTNI